MIDPIASSTDVPNEVADELVDPAEPVATTVALLDPLLKLQLTLVELKTEGDNATWDVETTEGEKAARAFRARCVSTRTEADDQYAKHNKPLLNAQKKARDLVAAIKAYVTPIEAKWDAKIVAKEQRKAEEKRLRDEAAKKKLLEIRQRIAFITEAPMRASLCKTAAAMADISEELMVMQFTEELFGDFADDAKAAADRAQTAVTALHDATVERENAAAELRHQQEELARQQAEVARVAAIQVCIDALRRTGEVASTAKTAAEVEAAIWMVESSRIQASSFGERVEEAEALKASVLADMRVTLKARQEAEAEASRIEQQRAENERVAADLKKQTDAFEEEKRQARETLAAEEARRTNGVNAELDSLSALQQANEPEVDEVFSTVMPDEPVVEQPLPAVVRVRQPDDEEILVAIAKAFNVSEHQALEWVSRFDITVQRNRLRRAA